MMRRSLSLEPGRDRHSRQPGCTSHEHCGWLVRQKIESQCGPLHNPCGSARGPVILPNFKLGDPSLRGRNGGFDSHTLPPTYFAQIN